MRVRAWAAPAAGKPLEPFEYESGPLGADEVEVAVEYCGLCHSDLSIIDNAWGNSIYPVVPGHEVVGRVAAVGSQVTGLVPGQRVGIGWNAGSCMHCPQCIGGEHNLCPRVQPTIIGHHGGFADRVRAHWAWVFPLPDGLDPAAAGPLLCGGITVFNPLLAFGVSPTARAGVVGIGGLGHMALMFLRAWGCEVTAFTASPNKYDEARRLGAHRALSSRDPAAIKAQAESLDFLLVTANVPLDWDAMLGTLAPHGRLHIVGVVLEPIPLRALDLINLQRQVSGSPVGPPARIATMLQFAARHKITPQVEHFPLARANDGLNHLRSRKAHYRVVLDAAGA